MVVYITGKKGNCAYFFFHIVCLKLKLQTGDAAHVFWHFNNWPIIEKMKKKMLDEYYLNNNRKCIQHKKKNML